MTMLTQRELLFDPDQDRKFRENGHWDYTDADDIVSIMIYCVCSSWALRGEQEVRRFSLTRFFICQRIGAGHLMHLSLFFHHV